MAKRKSVAARRGLKEAWSKGGEPMNKNRARGIRCRTSGQMTA
jgi:hypothetical protein